MNKSEITFSANEQSLIKTGGIDNYASNTVSYIEATFTLGENWTGFDSVRAVWESYCAKISTVLDSNYKCIVPPEVLKVKSKVNVNLVGSVVEGNVLTDRLTTYPILALTVDANAMVEGDETTAVTPSQFEQFVAQVHEDAESIQDYTYDSEAWAKGTRGGIAVSSDDPTYHNNSKYYADQGATLQQEVTDLKSDFNVIESDVATLLAAEQMYINTSVNKWIATTNVSYTIYPIKANDSIYLKAPIGGSVFYTLLTTAPPILNTTPTYATGFGIGFSTLTATSDITITVPADGKFLYLIDGYEPSEFTINNIPISAIYNGNTMRQRLVAVESEAQKVPTLESTVSEHTGKIASIESAISGGLTGEGGTVLISSVDDLLQINTINPNVAVLSKGTTFILSEQCFIPDNTVIIGNGATIKRADGYDGLLLRLANHCSIYGLQIDGNRLNTVNPTWENTTEIRIAGNDCLVENVNIADGNEAIIVYGNDVTIKSCRLSNCGGNGIHFSGAQRTRVEDCVVIGANKKSGMGHEDGCIIWSNACEHQVCINNWCEDGISGFGSIDSIDNANIKLIGNTVKDCTYAIEAQYTTLQPSKLLVDSNYFINSGSVLIRRIDNSRPAVTDVLLTNNMLEKTSIDCRYLSRLAVENNEVDLGYILAIGCPFCLINGNVVDSNDNVGISIESSMNAIVSNNSVLANLNAINASGAIGSAITANTLRVRILGTNNYPSSPAIATNSSKAVIIADNTILALYALHLYGETVCKGNIVKCRLSGETAIGASTAFTGIVKDNLYYGNFHPAAGDNKVVSDNLAVSAPDTYNVTYSLTNISKVGGDAVWKNDSLLVVLTAEEGYILPDTITVTMGGTTLPLITTGDYVDVPDGYTYDKLTGVLRIPSATGAIGITATAVSI